MLNPAQTGLDFLPIVPPAPGRAVVLCSAVVLHAVHHRVNVGLRVVVLDDQGLPIA
jgi:hypothetical protein